MFLYALIYLLVYIYPLVHDCTIFVHLRVSSVIATKLSTIGLWEKISVILKSCKDYFTMWVTLFALHHLVLEHASTPENNRIYL